MRTYRPGSPQERASQHTPGLTDAPLSPLDLALAVTAGAIIIGAASTMGPIAGLGGITIAVFVVYCLRRPELIGYTLVAVVPVASGLARGVPLPGVRLTEAMAVAAALVVLPRNVGQRSRRWRTLDWAALGYVGCHILVGGLAGATNGSLNITTLGLLVGPAQYFLMYRVIICTLDTSERRRHALRLLLFMVIPVSLLAVAQYLGAPMVQTFVQRLTQTDVFDLYTYESTRRATGPFAAWHPLAGYLFIPTVLAGSIAIQDRSTVMSRRTASVVLGFALAALLVSQTLNVLAGALVCFAIVAILQGTNRRLIYSMGGVVIVAIATFWPVLNQRVETQRVEDPLAQSSLQLPQTIQYRLDIWGDQYVPAIAEHWMIGYGPDLPPEITWRSTESLYFTLLLRGGVGLMGAFIVFAFIATKDGLALRRSSDDAARALGLSLFAVSLALIPMHAVFPYFTASGLPQVYWVVLALMTSFLIERDNSPPGFACRVPAPRTDPIASADQ